MKVFVDTSAWYAAADVDDRSHPRGADYLRRNAGNLVTSDHVLIETWFLANARLGYEVAERLISNIRTGVAVIEDAVAADLQVAAMIGETFADQRFSIVDRTSWAIMQRLGIESAISFDRDFAVFRYGPDHRKAFTVLG